MESSASPSKSDINMFFGRCKCCLEYGYMKDIWSEYYWEGMREIYGEMLMETFSVTWDSADDAREYICEGCVIRLRDAFNFKKDMLASEKLMDEDFDEFDNDSYKIEIIDDFEQSEENMNEEDTNRDEKQSASETEYYEVEYLEDEMEIKDEPGQPKTTNTESKQQQEICKWPTRRRREGYMRTYKNYTPDDLRLCLEAVRGSEMSVSEASRLYNVPRKTVAAKLIEKPKTKRLPDVPWVGRTEPRGRHKHQIPEVKKHRDNVRSVLENSNATPFKSQTGLFYSCNFCQKQYSIPKDLKDHTLELHKDVSKAADIKVAFGFSIKLDITDLKCKICDENMDLLEDLMCHLTAKHEVVIHMNVTNQMVPYKFDCKEMKCVICSHVFNYFKLLAEHMSAHYRNFECEICGTPFINKQRYKMHKERHKTGVYYCSFCPKAFDNKMRRRDHERVVHINGNKTQKCSYCNEKFVNIVQKLDHERAIHGGTYRVYKCHECDKDFDNQKALSGHAKRFHLIDKPFRCDECDMAFFRKPSLSKHMEKHSVVGDFLCMLCSKRFVDKNSIREHMKYHNVENRFEHGISDECNASD